MRLLHPKRNTTPAISDPSLPPLGAPSLLCSCKVTFKVLYVSEVPQLCLLCLPCSTEGNVLHASHVGTSDRTSFFCKLHDALLCIWTRYSLSTHSLVTLMSFSCADCFELHWNEHRNTGVYIALSVSIVTCEFILFPIGYTSRSGLWKLNSLAIPLTLLTLTCLYLLECHQQRQIDGHLDSWPDGQVDE